ncbi:MAG TPA: integrase arm-type DNA-binding domain-containing protein, partial [Thermoanaerobaculia bacterium]|nr:integrase arm-type DNA-binding domain-containing protein [Thermoanaerobaculia bacterium]
MRRITKPIVTGLKTTNVKGERVYDAELRGFAVRVMPDGSKFFEIRYGGRKNRRRLSIGRYGPLTLDDARAKARELLAQAELGEDPAAERDRVRAMPTFAEWKGIYVNRIRGRLKSAKWIGRYLDIAEARWKLRPLDSIARGDVEALFQKLGREHPTNGNRWLQSIRPLFAEAVREGLLASNPAEGVKRFLENPPRDRVLTDDEMKHVLDAIAGEKDVYARLALFLLVETGARLSEALRAKWEDLDLDAGTWRIPSPKAGHPQVVPLSRSIVAKLKRLPRLGSYVVASQSAGKPGEKPRFDLKKPWERVLA